MSLEIVRPWVFVFSIRAEWTNIARRVVDETVPDHFILPLETLSPFTT